MYDASLTVGLPPMFSEEYVSRVTINKDDMTVEARSIRSSAFESLKSSWKLRPVLEEDTNCIDSADRFVKSNEMSDSKWSDVEFSVEMSVSDPIIVAALDKVMEEVAGRQISAFEKRCEDVLTSEKIW
eukprot:CAMPEP_0113579630 /NCGR_PEP_ID=MMETSP0015_2-20120614/30180_1 /TAXON_ID=2838 /ORGANISM="Odontella" /LENGTH=127 /DNA_ID=CAMNT_0000483641 /DNA_START=147 /DNA_END=527 /DNA_ORIENTATION=+ /assembly_acc=CAM_ASM_000160